MGRTHDSLDERLAAWIASQPVFFVASAPLGPEGHVNCSPKGNRGELAVLGPSKVAFLDQTGSGTETIAHLRDNGRIVLMFCAFSGPPRIVRLHGRGSFFPVGDPGFDVLRTAFDGASFAGARSAVVVEVTRIADSCGHGVPLMDFLGHRSQLDDWAVRKGPQGLEDYRRDRNALSIDGLPGFRPTA